MPDLIKAHCHPLFPSLWEGFDLDRNVILFVKIDSDYDPLFVLVLPKENAVADLKIARIRRSSLHDETLEQCKSSRHIVNMSTFHLL